MCEESEWYRKWYFRGHNEYNTSVVALGNLFYYVFANVAGYVYVNVCNLRYGTGTIFRSHDNEVSDFYKTILFSPFLFFISAVVVLRAEHDLADSMELVFLDCKKITLKEFYMHNQLVWFSAFLVGLQFTYADAGVL